MIYTLEQIRDAVAPIAKKYQIPAVYLFGSYARGTATEESDIDLLVDTTGTDLTSLLKLGALYCDLEASFEVPVDMVTVGAIEQKPQMKNDQIFRENVLRERKMIYAVA